MGLSDNDVQKQLQHMMNFIEQEATEKAEEIDAKAEEEFNIEKGRLVQQQRTKIMDFFEKKEKQVELQRKINNSHMLNQARIELLKSREEHIKNVLDEAVTALQRISADAARYPTILQGLIEQALFQMLEDESVLRCRQRDLPLVEKVLPSAVDKLKKEPGSHSANAKVAIDRQTFLSPDSAGGVELFAKGGKIRVVCTLESRLEMLSQQMVPEIRTALFGRNPNRKFDD